MFFRRSAVEEVKKDELTPEPAPAPAQQGPPPCYHCGNPEMGVSVRACCRQSYAAWCTSSAA
jgi:hypothetical protein